MPKQKSAMQQLNRRFLSSLITISLIMSIVEGLIMLTLNFYHEKIRQLLPYQGVIANAALLALICAPLLWFIVLRPLVVRITQQQDKVAKQARLNAELRAALDTHALVSITDTAGRIIFANDAFCEASGYSMDELMGKDHRIVKSGYHSKEFIRTMWETLAAGKIWQGVFCNCDKNGRMYWLDSTITPLLDEEGKPYQYISIRRDTTAQKIANDQLIILKQAVDACSEMIIITNTHGSIQYANPAFYQVTGWTAAALVGRNLSVLDSPHADKAVLASLQQALQRNEGWSGRLLNRRKGIPPLRSEGQPAPAEALDFWAELYVTPFMNENGALSGYVQIQRDISVQVAMEELAQFEQQDTQARLAIANALQQALPLKERFIKSLAILFTLKSLSLQNKGGVFLRAEDGEFLNLFVAQGDFSDEFLDQEQQVALGSCLCGRAAASGEILVSDDCFCDPRHDHQYEDMQAHGHYIVPIIATGGTNLGVLFLYTDPYPVRHDSRMTMLKQLGDMFALAILQEQATVSLESARDLAMQAALAKSEFLANMSHEIRTPMNGVLGMLDLLRDTNMSRSQWDLVETAHSSAEALLQILNDILDFSKLEAGKLEMEQIDFNLTALIEDVCSLLAMRAHSKGLELNCFTPLDMPRRWLGDPTRIRQVLTNLIGNAIKFTEQGEVSVTVKFLLENEGQGHLRFDVRDTGVGIAGEVQAHLFKPFSQAESNTARRFGGTGLGLSISKNLVVLMGGAIGVESVLGQGSCFWVELPLALGGSEPVYTPPLDIVDKHILVVDDNATNRTILQHYLTHWGFAVKQVDCGRAALAELAAGIAHGTPYDLALVDMHMPEMDGLELARIIAANPELAGVPRILLSSGGLVGEAERQTLGFSQSLLKPVRQSQLFDAIANALHASTSGSVVVQISHDAAIPNYKGKKLLVVEDNRVNQKVINGMLAKFQVAPEVAENGQIALDLLKVNTYDLILMDCQMPVLDGYQATRELRHWEAQQQLPRQVVIALTAHAVAGEREKCLGAGMDDYLTKPITWCRLLEIMERWLGQDSTEAKLHKSAANVPAYSQWDYAAALKGLEGDQSLLLDMISSFLDEMPEQLCTLLSAQERRDFAALAEAAHAIKGSASYFYATEVCDSASQLEHAALAKQAVDYRHMSEVLLDAVTRLMESLRPNTH